MEASRNGRRGSGLALAGVLLASACAPRATLPTGTDCHMHVTPRPQSEFIPQDAARVLSALEGAGLLRGCILSPGYTQPEGCKTADCPGQRDRTTKDDDFTLAQAAKSASLLAFCGIPIGPSWAPDEVRRCAKLGARGLKMHPASQGLSLNDPKTYAELEDVARAAAQAKLPILIHVDFTEAEGSAFLKLAAAHPETTFIIAHQLGFQFKAIASAPGNVWIDISGIVLAPRSVGPGFVAMWRAIGMKRILLGSDWPNLHPSEYMAALRAFPLTDAERRMIVTENARRLFP